MRFGSSEFSRRSFSSVFFFISVLFESRSVIMSMPEPVKNWTCQLYERRRSAARSLYIEQLMLWAYGRSSSVFGIISRSASLFVQSITVASSLHSSKILSTNTFKNIATFSLTHKKSAERYYKYPTYCCSNGNTCSDKSSKLATDRSMLVRISYADFCT